MEKWYMKERCQNELGFENIILKGCGHKNIITEETLTTGGCLYRNNAYLGYYCKHCGLYHIPRQFAIPEEIKDKVYNREHPLKGSNIIPFPRKRIHNK